MSSDIAKELARLDYDEDEVEHHKKLLLVT